MEQQFIALWLENRARAAKLGVRMRPITAENALRDAHRCLTGNRGSDGFSVLADKNRLDLTLEALAVDKRLTALFSDDEANTALNRLLSAGYRF